MQARYLRINEFRVCLGNFDRFVEETFCFKVQSFACANIPLRVKRLLEDLHAWCKTEMRIFMLGKNKTWILMFGKTRLRILLFGKTEMWRRGKSLQLCEIL